MNLPPRQLARLFLPAAAAVMFSLPAVGQEEPNSASDEKKPEPTKVSGVLESTVMHEITPDAEQIDSWTIKRILPHGSEVKKGQNVVWFETEDLEKRLKDAEIALRLAKLDLDDEEFKHKQFLETQKLDRAAAERTITKARKDHDNFVQVDRPRTIRTAEYNLESAIASLENAQEELEQLEQMYKEDDLTEESEEIVLKRAKRAVESAEFRLEGTKVTTDRTLQQGVAEQTASQEDALARAELNYQQSIRNLDSARKKQDIEMDKKRTAYKEQAEKLDELRAERKQSVLTSPIDGILLHGPLIRGRIGDKPSTLEEGSKVTAKQVIATVVDPGKLQVRADLAEKDLAHVQVGESCKVTVAAVPDYEGSGVVKSVGSVPYAAAKYDCVVTLKKSKAGGQLMPTMTCKLEFAPQEGDDEK